MPKAKAGTRAASKLGYEDVECTTIDGRVYKMGDWFIPADFAVSDDDREIVIKHDGMQRVMFKLFKVISRTLRVHETPKKSNEWCAVVSCCLEVVPKSAVVVEVKSEESEDDQTERISDAARFKAQLIDTYTWEAVADCRTSNSMPGMGKYTTAVAETRASGRVIRRLLGLEGFCTKEELAETTLDAEDDSSPMHGQQYALVQRFLNDDGKRYKDITLETVNKRLKRKEGDEGLILSTDEEKEWKEKLTVGQAAILIDKLHTYDIKKSEE